jgi:hypothetical protein
MARAQKGASIGRFQHRVHVWDFELLDIPDCQKGHIVGKFRFLTGKP